MRSSCIRHPENEPLIIVRQWQIEFCEGNRTAAALLSFFEYWHSIKIEQSPKAARQNEIAEMHGEEGSQDTSLWQFHTEEQLEAGILLFKRTAIGESINLLVEKGAIQIGRNPNPRFKFDRTRWFLFNPGVINAWLDRRSLPIVPSSKSDGSSTKSDGRSTGNVGRSTGNDATITETTTETNKETTTEIDPDPPAQSTQATAREDSAKIKAYREAQHRSLFPVKEKRSAEDPANAPSKVSAGGPDNDGQWLRVQIQDAGFTTYGANFLREAAELEETFKVEQLIRALQNVKEVHAKKIESGEKGIWNVLSYMRKVLLNPESDKKGSTNASNRKQLSIKPTGPIFTEESRRRQLDEPF